MDDGLKFVIELLEEELSDFLYDIKEQKATYQDIIDYLISISSYFDEVKFEMEKHINKLKKRLEFSEDRYHRLLSFHAGKRNVDIHPIDNNVLPQPIQEKIIFDSKYDEWCEQLETFLKELKQFQQKKE